MKFQIMDKKKKRQNFQKRKTVTYKIQRVQKNCVGPCNNNKPART